MLPLLYEKLTDKAFPPTKGSELAAGFDISSPHDYIVSAQKRLLIPSDLKIFIPEGYYGQLASRSGLSYKHCIDVKAGVIDRDYMGNVGIVLSNHSDKDYNIKRGDRIAQLLILKCLYTDVHEITKEEKKKLDEKDDNARKGNGFGSTGR